MTRRRVIVAVIGSGRAGDKAVNNARALGRSVAERGWVLISGGRNAGVMLAANEGARESGGLTVGILPDRETEISPAVEIAVITDMGEARNNVIVLSADVVVACGVEDPGTTSEVALALKAGKPVVLLGADEAARQFFRGLGGDLCLADTVDQTIEQIETIATAIKGTANSQ